LDGEEEAGLEREIAVAADFRRWAQIRNLTVGEREKHEAIDALVVQ
jgi:hypothetical protein